LFATAIALVSLAMRASAHAELESCEPPMGATVKSPPDRIVCTATESMDAKRSWLQVFDSVGARVDTGASQVEVLDRDRRIISVPLDASRLGDGIYTIRWRTLSADDGDEASGEFKLTVRR
jgi:copper resistance protein C